MKYLMGLTLSFFLMASLARADGVTVVFSISVENLLESEPVIMLFPSLAELPPEITIDALVPIGAGFLGFESGMFANRDSNGTIDGYFGPIAVPNGVEIPPPGFVYNPSLPPEEQWPFGWVSAVGSGSGVIVTSEPRTGLLLLIGAAFGLLLLRRLHA